MSLTEKAIDYLEEHIPELAEVAFTPIPINAELTTQEAADLLRLSYKKKMEAESRKAREELTREAQEFDMVY